MTHTRASSSPGPKERSTLVSNDEQVRTTGLFKDPRALPLLFPLILFPTTSHFCHTRKPKFAAYQFLTFLWRLLGHTKCTVSIVLKTCSSNLQGLDQRTWDSKWEKILPPHCKAKHRVHSKIIREFRRGAWQRSVPHSLGDVPTRALMSGWMF